MIKEYIAYLKDNPEGYWFKARLFGYGWMPATWQGWVTMLIFLILVLANAYRFVSQEHSRQDVPVAFLIETFLLVALLLAICILKGEKPKWQFGIPEKYKNK
ncbi:MAG: hypothetical protein ABIP54_04290 [Candidatus Andersenbacteria bacterium]